MADLATLDDVRRYLFGNEVTLDADGILSSLITSSSAWIERRCGRTFGSSTVTETRDGDGTQRMMLNDSPPTAVTSVTVDGVVIPQRTDVGDTGWVFADSGVDLIGYYFTKGMQNVVFVYSAGEVVPADIKQAVIEHVALRYRDRGHVGLSSHSADGETTTYSTAGALAYIEGVIASYQELGFA